MKIINLFGCWEQEFNLILFFYDFHFELRKVNDLHFFKFTINLIIHDPQWLLKFIQETSSFALMNYCLLQFKCIICQPHFIEAIKMVRLIKLINFSIIDLLSLIFDAFHYHLNSFIFDRLFCHYLLSQKLLLIIIINGSFFSSFIFMVILIKKH